LAQHFIHREREQRVALQTRFRRIRNMELSGKKSLIHCAQPPFGPMDCVARDNPTEIAPLIPAVSLYSRLVQIEKNRRKRRFQKRLQ